MCSNTWVREDGKVIPNPRTGTTGKRKKGKKEKKREKEERNLFIGDIEKKRHQGETLINTPVSTLHIRSPHCLHRFESFTTPPLRKFLFQYFPIAAI
jgi:hypothetical protein